MSKRGSSFTRRANSPCTVECASHAARPLEDQPLRAMQAGEMGRATSFVGPVVRVEQLLRFVERFTRLLRNRIVSETSRDPCARCWRRSGATHPSSQRQSPRRSRRKSHARELHSQAGPRARALPASRRARRSRSPRAREPNSATRSRHCP